MALIGKARKGFVLKVVPLTSAPFRSHPHSQTYTGECHHPPNTCREHQGRLSASAPPLARHMGRINALPKTQQKFVMQMIDTVLAQQGR